MRTLILSLAAAALVAPAAPALADPPRHAPAWGHRAKERHHHRDRHYREVRRDRIYDARGRYLEPRRLSRRDRIWRARDGGYYCHRDNGTTGLVIGAGVGALAGHTVAGYRDKTVGTILGAVAGGLLGREIDRGELRCR